VVAVANRAVSTARFSRAAVRRSIKRERARLRYRRQVMMLHTDLSIGDLDLDLDQNGYPSNVSVRVYVREGRSG